MKTATHTFWLEDGTEIGIVSSGKTVHAAVRKGLVVSSFIQREFGLMPQDQDPPHSKAISFVDTRKEK